MIRTNNCIKKERTDQNYTKKLSITDRTWVQCFESVLWEYKNTAWYQENYNAFENHQIEVSQIKNGVNQNILEKAWKEK